jgi:hypothetical protein
MRWLVNDSTRHHFTRSLPSTPRMCLEAMWAAGGCMVMRLRGRATVKVIVIRALV